MVSNIFLKSIERNEEKFLHLSNFQDLYARKKEEERKRNRGSSENLESCGSRRNEKHDIPLDGVNRN